MSLYTAVSFKIDEIERALVCEGPLGSVGLAVLYNMCVIQYSDRMLMLGPMDEKSVQNRISLTIQCLIEKIKVDSALLLGVYTVLKQHQELIAHPVLIGPEHFRNNFSYWLFTLSGSVMLHGWVLDPEVSLYQSIKNYTRDELLEYRDGLENQEDQAENLALIQCLLDAAENQLTDYGFRSLFAEIEENKFNVVFCYNRFNIVHMHQGKLFILETSMVVHQNFPGVVWRYFDGGALEESILLTGEYIPVAGQPNFDEKAGKWARAMSTNESSGTSSQEGNLSKSQRRSLQRKKARQKRKENANALSDGASDAKTEQSQGSAGDVMKDDSKKDEEQGTKNDVPPAAEIRDAEVTVGGVIKDNIKEVGQRTEKEPAAEAKDIEVTAGDGIKDDSEKELGQGNKKDEFVQPSAETKDTEVIAGDVIKDDIKKQVGQGSEKEEIIQPAAKAKNTEVTAGDGIKDGCEKELGQGKKKDEFVQPSAETKDTEVTAGVVTKDDSKKEDGQGHKKKEDKPSGSAQMISKENEKSLGNMSLEPLKPEETKIAAQGQSADVSNFFNFLLGYKHDGHSSYFRGILEAFKEAHKPWFFVPYEFIMQHDEPLALKIQDHYSSIQEDLKESVVQYLQMHQVTYPDVRLKILGLPKPKSVQTFEDYIASIILLEVYEVYGGGLDKSPSYDGRKMSLGYLHCILDKFKTGRCWGGEWNESNMKVHSGSEFVIHCEQDMELTGDFGVLDLVRYSEKVLQRFKDEDGILPSYFDEFDTDCFHFPDPADTVKWERFLELIGSPFGLKHPLVRSSLICNSYLAANAHASGDPPRYMPLCSRKGCQDFRTAAQ